MRRTRWLDLVDGASERDGAAIVLGEAAMGETSFLSATGTGQESPAEDVSVLRDRTPAPARHELATRVALTGRRSECSRLDRLLAGAHDGHSAAMVVRGEPGIGKSAMLEYAAKRGEGCRVLRVGGVESEMELPFAGLHQLCTGLLDGRRALPAPQREALEAAFGLSAGVQPDRFLVGLAVLSLLSEAAQDSPLLCLVDDVQWLDRSSAQVVGFVARRLAAESVVLLLAECEPSGVEELAGLPELRLGGLAEPAARALLASVIAAPLDERVRDRIIAESRGNPLALLELPRGSSPVALAGGFGLAGGGSLPERIEASFQRRVQQLPDATRRLLLLAAADPTGEPALLLRAAAEIGISIEKLAPAEADGLLELGLRVAFRHPLLRSAIYRAAPSDERRIAHRALAAATDAELSPDRRAWHRAHATVAPDDQVASELEHAAERARARGGLAAAGAFLERAAALTADPRHRVRRALEAASTKRLAGDPQAALALLATVADASPVDEVDGAMLKRLKGQMLLDLSRNAEALPHLLDAGRRLEPTDPGLARDTHLEAVRAAANAGRLGAGTLEAAKAARAAPPRPQGSCAVDLLLDGLAARFIDGYVASAPALKQALGEVRGDGGREHSLRWAWLGLRVAPDLFSDDTWHELATRSVRLAREQGALAVLPVVLNSLAGFRCLEGDLDGAASLIDEADAISAATGIEPVMWARLALAGLRGNEARALALFDAAESDAIARGDGAARTAAEHARAVLYNGLGRYDAALAPAQSAGTRDELLVSVLCLPELVEAAARCGEIEVANDALKRLTERARAADTDWALGIEARSRALLSDGVVADQLYRDAIDHLEQTRATIELTRTRLLYGEWLRRGGRRVDAREQLRAAYDQFSSIGMEAFAERARRELLATGEHVHKRTAETRDDLTAQERQIAQLARDGLSNAEIGARLFLSQHTVAYHLRKVFSKLEITSRNQLRRALDDAASG